MVAVARHRLPVGWATPGYSLHIRTHWGRWLWRFRWCCRGWRLHWLRLRSGWTASFFCLWRTAWLLALHGCYRYWPEQQLSRFIDNRSQTDKGGRLTGMDIREYIRVEFGVDYHLSHIYKVLAKLGYSWITSRSKHPKQQSGVQDAYKKVPSGNDP